MVAAVAFLAHRRAPEFSTPDDQRLVQKAAGLEVGNEPDYGQIDLPAKFGVVALHLGVAVPLAAGSVIELDESDPALDQTAGEEALLTEDLGILLIQPVKSLGRRGLLFKVDRFGGMHLHVGGQFITADARFQLAVGFPALEVSLI